MPGDVDGVGAEGDLGCEGERAAVEVGELEVGAAGKDGFGDVGLGDLDAQVVVDGPEAASKRSWAVGSIMGSDPIMSGSLTPSATGWLKGSATR